MREIAAKAHRSRMVQLKTARPPRVLIVEDHDDTRDLYSTAFMRSGFEVYAIANYRDAVPIVDALGAVAAVVIDLGLDGNGFEFARRVRQLWPAVPLLAVTGRQRDGHPLEALFDAYLMKPCLPDEVVRVVERLIAAHDPGQS